MDDLTKELVCLAMKPEDLCSPAKLDEYRSHGPAWKSTIETLIAHRIAPLIYHELERKGLARRIPDEYHAMLKKTFMLSAIYNHRKFASLGRLADRLSRDGIGFVVWKGLVLADSFYPDPGARTMYDIDLSVDSANMQHLRELLQSSGYRWHVPRGAPFDDAISAIDEDDTSFDIHHRVRLFEGKEGLGLTTSLEPIHVKAPVLTVLEPNAMVALLLAHMDGHRRRDGHVLSWILDIAFVLRKWGQRLDPGRLRQLLPSGDHLSSLHRIAGFLSNEFAESLPDFLAVGAAGIRPLTFPEIFRQRRLALWGLPGPRGWLRLAARAIGVGPKKRRPPLLPGDILNLPGDILVNLLFSINIYKRYKY